MKRRDFIRSVGYAVFAYPLAAWAQRATPAVGFLNGSSATAYAAYDQAFIRGLAETGLKIGVNVSIVPKVATIKFRQWLTTLFVVR
jgi:hypothetical protein